jgi:hypothetical protein
MGRNKLPRDNNGNIIREDSTLEKTDSVISVEGSEVSDVPEKLKTLEAEHSEAVNEPTKKPRRKKRKAIIEEVEPEPVTASMQRNADVFEELITGGADVIAEKMLSSDPLSETEKHMLGKSVSACVMSLTEDDLKNAPWIALTTTALLIFGPRFYDFLERRKANKKLEIANNGPTA